MWTESSNACFAVNTCRICAFSSEVLIPIFGSVDDHKERVDYKIIKYLPIMVRKNDSKPKYICFSCVSKLEVCRELHELSRASDFKFNNMLFSAALTSKEASSEKSVAPPSASEGRGFMVDLSYKDTQDSVITQGQQILPQGIDLDTRSVLELPSRSAGHDSEDDGSSQPPQFSGEAEESDESSRDTSIEPGSPEVVVGAYRCDICGKAYRRKTNLNSHKITHTQVRPHGCQVCGARFVARWNLTMHMRLHACAFACAVCGKAFPVRSKLERHQRTHTGERPYVCTTCGRAFADKRNLAGHERTHSDARPYVCAVCGRSFRVQAHLKEHSRVHSSSAAYGCDICGKRFKWKTNLNIHLKVHTGNRHACPECGREFSRRSDLSKHQRTHPMPAPKPAMASTEPALASTEPAPPCAAEAPAWHAGGKLAGITSLNTIPEHSGFELELADRSSTKIG